MRTFTLLAVAVAAVGAQAASAEITTTFRGFRIEGNAGGDRFQSQGNHNDKFGYGGTVGFDGQIGEKVVIGAEGSYWRPGKGNENVTGYSDGTVYHKGFEEWGAAVRAGYLVTPDFLVFAKGGWATTDQRKRFQLPGGATQYYNHTGVDGYQLGGGVEYSLSRFNVPVYVNAQYVYTNYDNHTARQRLMGGVGIRFK